MKAADTWQGSLRTWHREHVHDPRPFEHRPAAATMRDWFDAHAAELVSLRRQIEDSEGPVPKELRDRVTALEGIFSDTPDDPDAPIVTGDPVIDEWERQIARGEEPQF